MIDRLESRIQKFDGIGTLKAMWGSKGSSLGELNKPEDIAINNKTGEVFITDTQNSRVQVFHIEWKDGNIGDNTPLSNRNYLVLILEDLNNCYQTKG